MLITVPAIWDAEIGRSLYTSSFGPLDEILLGRPGWVPKHVGAVNGLI